jgi:hypothetical protein
MSVPDFIPGIELSRLFYFAALLPILQTHFPGLPHAAARLGDGSDVLGFDTPMSTDHGWGPSVNLFLREEDILLAPQIREVMSRELPYTFHGYSTNFGDSPLDPGTPVLNSISEGPINHNVSVQTVRGFVQDRLGFDLTHPLEPADWLTFPSQILLTLTSGAVYYDGTGELTAMRERFAYYSHDVWLYLLASGWQRISQEEHLMPRAGYLGDDLGSSIIGSRLVRDIISLCFYMERRYAPYPKWFGTAFNQLACAADLLPILTFAQTATVWQDREAALVEAYEYLARAHNALGITEPLSESAQPFFGRPFKVIFAERFAQAIVARITDPAMQGIASRRLIGSIDQFSDSTDLRSYPQWREALRRLYT